MGGAFGWIVAGISMAGYGGLIGLMALESACIPLPSEIIMPFAGFLVSQGRFNLFAAATAGALGCNLGSAAAWWIGARGGRAAVRRWGRYVLFDEGELRQVERFFHRYGGAAVFLGRLLPIIRTFISLPAGISQMPFLRFQLYTFLGSWPWCLGLAYLGLRLGNAWNTDPTVKAAFARVDWVIGLALVALFAAYIWRRWKTFHGQAR